MNRKEIKKIGLEAGISEFAFGLASEEAWQQVERFVALVISVEREACAKVCEYTDIVEYQYCMALHDDAAQTLRNAAAAIRTRGEK